MLSKCRQHAPLRFRNSSKLLCVEFRQLGAEVMPVHSALIEFVLWPQFRLAQELSTEISPLLVATHLNTGEKKLGMLLSEMVSRPAEEPQGSLLYSTYNQTGESVMSCRMWCLWQVSSVSCHYQSSGMKGAGSDSKKKSVLDEAQKQDRSLQS